jgi:hypothetical protein
MILPGMGVVSELVTCYARKPLFGYKFVAWASIAIALIGFFVWGHHMFVSGQSVFAGLVFSFMSFMVAVPSAIKVFNWTATLHKGWVSYDAPMLYALAFIGLFTIGGLTGLFLACLAFIATSQTQFRRNTCCNARTLHVSAGSDPAKCLRLVRHSSMPRWRNSTTRRSSACGHFLQPRSCFSAG